MTTLIAVCNSSGYVGRCDARCYNALDKECDCICGGANHGKGRAVAVENAKKHADEWLAKYKETHSEVTCAATQLPLV
jgi:hypothetical protein